MKLSCSDKWYICVYDYYGYKYYDYISGIIKHMFLHKLLIRFDIDSLDDIY